MYVSRTTRMVSGRGSHVASLALHVHTLEGTMLNECDTHVKAHSITQQSLHQTNYTPRFAAHFGWNWCRAQTHCVLCTRTFMLTCTINQAWGHRQVANLTNHRVPSEPEPESAKPLSRKGKGSARCSVPQTVPSAATTWVLKLT